MPKDTNYVIAINSYAAFMIQEGKFEQAFSEIEKMNALSEKLNFPRGFYCVNNLKGYIAYSKQDMKKALSYFLICKDIIKKNNLNRKLYQASLNNLSIMYSQMGNKEDALKMSFELIEFQEKFDVQPFQTNPYKEIGDNYKEIGKYEDALKYYNKELEIETSYNVFSGMGISENNIGQLYEKKGENKVAKIHYEIGLKHAEKADYPLLQAEILSNLGRVTHALGDKKMAITYLKKAEKIARELESQLILNNILGYLGAIYLETKEYDASEKHYKEALDSCKTINDFDYTFKINSGLAKLYHAKGDFKQAYKYQLDAETAKDSTYKTEVTKNSSELIKKYETSKKEQEIALLNQKNKTANLQNKSILGGGIMLLLLIGFIAFSIINRNKLKELEHTQKLRNRIAADLHDEIGSTLSSISLISGMSKGESPTVTKMFNKIHKDSKSVMESMDEIIWSVSSVNDSLKGIYHRIQQYVRPLAEPTNIHFVFEFDENLEKVELPMETRRNVFLIVKEAVNNVLKYSGAEMCKVQFEKHKKEIFINISDDGMGFDKAEINNERNGLKNLQHRADAIGGTLTISSDIGKGTTIFLKIHG